LNKIVSKKKTSAIFLAIVLLTGTITLFSPSFMAGAQAQPYYGMDDRYDSYEAEYTDNNNYEPTKYPSYNREYPSDNSYESKESSSTIIKKVKCNNINSNNNGVDVSLGIPNNDALVEAQAADNEGQATTANGFGNGDERYKQNDNDFKFVCINNNDNENNVIVINETTPEPEPIPPPQPTITCEKCFDLILTEDEELIVFSVLSSLVGPITLEQFCTIPISGFISEDELISALGSAISLGQERILNLIECLLEAGIVFET
jgi:hypothetical protein